MNSDAAKNFANYWYEHGDREISNYQDFWRDLLHDVFGVERTTGFIEFQKPVPHGAIDAYIAKTKVLIEHKSSDEDLTKGAYEQAMRYVDALPANEKPSWIVTCNFVEFRIYRAKNLFETATTVIKLRDLRYQYERLKFLIDPNADDSPPAEKISKDAIEIITNIYNAFANNYKRNHVDDFEDALNKICTRLVFCLYAGDAQLFDANQFFNYLQSFPDHDRNAALQNLFDALNTPDDQRDDLDDALKDFPYVNGGLFDEKIPLPAFNRNANSIASIGVFNSRRNFSWHEISPPIFGAMFESTFSRKNKQRASGMYYTSEDNIHKVIDPLFLDDLYNDFDLANRRRIQNRAQALFDLQDKLSKLTFLDPACGSGNFLTETYLSLRRLENEILEKLRGLNVDLPANPVKVSINQFYGIELDSFAVAVAQTALWIAENQMLQQTEGAIGKTLQALPLKNYATIIKANALRVDWQAFAPNVDYIIGNPPYRGYSDQTPEQKADMRRIFADNPKAGKIDYVAAWYKKASECIQGTAICCAFVSTNSLCQGDSVGTLWKKLFAEGVHIDFAHRTFKWLSDSENKAHVYCVVVGFSCANNDKPKLLIDGNKVTVANNINAYLVDGENIFVESRPNHLQDDVPEIVYGSKPADGSHLIIKASELDHFIKNEPSSAQKYIRLLLGADEFIKGKRRYCLWLKGIPMSEIESMPLVAERVEACHKFRLLSKKDATRADAETPHLFQEIRQPTTEYILIPCHSSGCRNYIPIGFMPHNVIASNATLIVPSATLYHFGVLTSSIHMAWTRTTAGYLGTSYRYSASIVYNNFVWASPSGRQRRRIEETAQEILKVRAAFPAWTYAKLYDEATMPQDLRDAHRENDLAVAIAYGFEDIINDEAAIVAELMKLYKRLTND